MDRRLSMPEIIGYLHAQISTAIIELEVNLKVRGEPSKDSVEEVIERLKRTYNQSEEFWKNRVD